MGGETFSFEEGCAKCSPPHAEDEINAFSIRRDFTGPPRSTCGAHLGDDPLQGTHRPAGLAEGGNVASLADGYIKWTTDFALAEFVCGRASKLSLQLHADSDFAGD